MSEQEPPRPYLLKVEEAAHKLSISRVAVYRLMNKGELPSIKIGGSRSVSVRALEAYIQQLEVEGEATP